MIVTGKLPRAPRSSIFIALTWAATWAAAPLVWSLLHTLMLGPSTSPLRPWLNDGVVLFAAGYGITGFIAGLICSRLLLSHRLDPEAVSAGRVALFGALASLFCKSLIAQLVVWRLTQEGQNRLLFEFVLNLPAGFSGLLMMSGVGAIASTGTLHIARREAEALLIEGSPADETPTTLLSRIP